MVDNIAAVAALYEAFGRGDVPAILDGLDDQVSWDERVRESAVPYIAGGRGKERVGAFFAHLGATLEISQFDIGTMCAAGDTVMVPITVAGRIIGGGEIPPNVEVHIWKLDGDGKVVSFEHVADWALHEAAFAQRAADHARV